MHTSSILIIFTCSSLLPSVYPQMEYNQTPTTTTHLSNRRSNTQQKANKYRFSDVNLNGNFRNAKSAARRFGKLKDGRIYRLIKNTSAQTVLPAQSKSLNLTEKTSNYTTFYPGRVVNHFKRIRKQIEHSPMFATKRVVEVHVLVDKYVYKQLKNSVNASTYRAIDIISEANYWFDQINIQLQIVRIDVWNVSQLLTYSRYQTNGNNRDSLQKLITALKLMRRKGLAFDYPSDVTLLLIGKNVPYLGNGGSAYFSMCSYKSSVAVIPDRSSIFTAALLLVHHLGHTMGSGRIINSQTNVNCKCIRPEEENNNVDVRCIMVARSMYYKV